MSGLLEDVVKRWTAKRKSALVIEIIQEVQWIFQLKHWQVPKHPNDFAAPYLSGPFRECRRAECSAVEGPEWFKPSSLHPRTLAYAARYPNVAEGLEPDLLRKAAYAKTQTFLSPAETTVFDAWIRVRCACQDAVH